MKNTVLRNAVRAAIITSIFAGTGIAYAGSFQPYIDTANGLANVYAGSAAVAEDPSTAFWNPAGLVLLKQQEVVASAEYVNNSNKFNGSTTSRSTGSTVTGPANSSFQGVSPQAYYALPFDEKFAFGLGINHPFAAGLAYPDNSSARFIGTRYTQIVTDISPNLAYLITPKFSAGFGADVNYQRSQQNFNISLGPVADNISRNKASDFAYGWHAGLMYQLTPCKLGNARVGLAYHSEVDYTPTGTSTLETTSASAIKTERVGNSFSYKLSSPAFTTLSIYDELNQQWGLLGSIDYTQWGSIKDVTIRNVVVPVTVGTYTTTSLTSNLNLKNSFRYSLGAIDKYNSRWTFRAGVAYDASPVPDATRSTALGDAADAIVTGLGAQYAINKDVSVGVGYAHYFFKDETINLTTNTSLQSGTLKSARNVVGAQVNWKI